MLELGSRTARPQAAGTCRYHLPFNVADETVFCFPGGKPVGWWAALSRVGSRRGEERRGDGLFSSST